MWPSWGTFGLSKPADIGSRLLVLLFIRRWVGPVMVLEDCVFLWSRSAMNASEPAFLVFIKIFLASFTALSAFHCLGYGEDWRDGVQNPTHWRIAWNLVTRIADHCPIRAPLVCRSLQSEPRASWLLLSTWCCWGGPTRRNHCSNPRSQVAFPITFKDVICDILPRSAWGLMTYERLFRLATLILSASFAGGHVMSPVIPGQ